MAPNKRISKGRSAANALTPERPAFNNMANIKLAKERAKQTSSAQAEKENRAVATAGSGRSQFRRPLQPANWDLQQDGEDSQSDDGSANLPAPHQRNLTSSTAIDRSDSSLVDKDVEDDNEEIQPSQRGRKVVQEYQFGKRKRRVEIQDNGDNVYTMPRPTATVSEKGRRVIPPPLPDMVQNGFKKKGTAATVIEPQVVQQDSDPAEK